MKTIKTCKTCTKYLSYLSYLSSCLKFRHFHPHPAFNKTIQDPIATCNLDSNHGLILEHCFAIATAFEILLALRTSAAISHSKDGMWQQPKDLCWAQRVGPERFVFAQAQAVQATFKSFKQIRGTYGTNSVDTSFVSTSIRNEEMLLGKFGS